jgi:hypothetical protein
MCTSPNIVAEVQAINLYSRYFGRRNTWKIANGIPGEDEDYMKSDIKQVWCDV